MFVAAATFDVAIVDAVLHGVLEFIRNNDDTAMSSAVPIAERVKGTETNHVSKKKSENSYKRRDRIHHLLSCGE